MSNTSPAEQLKEARLQAKVRAFAFLCFIVSGAWLTLTFVQLGNDRSALFAGAATLMLIVTFWKLRRVERRLLDELRGQQDSDNPATPN